MTFSIVIPTFNGQAYIEDSIRSVLQQTRMPDEIIVSDDNSTDNTLTICEKYADKIQIYPNFDGPSGFVNGWNNAITKATGSYITILHQDDILAPTFLEEVERALKKRPNVKHLFVPCNYINEQGYIIKEADYCDNKIHLYSGTEYINAYQTIGYPHIHRCPGVITHRDIFQYCQYRKEAGHIADDDFFYRVGQYTDIIGILKPLASYRLHQDSETGHLGNNRLIMRLADDYIFQVTEWRNNLFMPRRSFNYFVYWAIHYVFNEYYLGIKNKDENLIKKGEENIQRIRQLNLSFPLKMKIFILLSKCIGNFAMHKITNLR